MKAKKIFLFFGFLTFIFGTTFIKAQESKTPAPTSTTETKQNTADLKPESLATDANPNKNSSDEKYRIGFQDSLEIQVYRHPELTQQVNVNADGTINLHRIERPVVAVCKTERELANIIAEQYKIIFKNPNVNVRTIEQRSQPVAIVGAVEKPGSFNLNRKIRLLELLAFAGGPDVENAGSKVQIARIGNVTGCKDSKVASDEDTEVEFLRFNLNNVLEGKENPFMQPGDIVSVLVAEEVYVVGNVMKPTKIVLRDSRTLTQAIAEAGGLNKTAKTDNIIIQRQEPGSTVKKELSFNLKEIRSQKIADPQLQGNDIVVVGNDNLKSVSKGFMELVKTSFPFLLF
ncbi:MAG: polysaccharide export protein [Pyrinomonadaceae bacterium]|nr:polysaccharide export protein [Pyrinomonadaceae bacterium]